LFVLVFKVVSDRSSIPVRGSSGEQRSRAAFQGAGGGQRMALPAAIW
jgi:hypothetical protein